MIHPLAEGTIARLRLEYKELHDMFMEEQHAKLKAQNNVAYFTAQNDMLTEKLMEARRLAEEWRTRCMGEAAQHFDQWKLPWEVEK